jgi:OFA family oxalate/formate antiporter-like MFS transporter
MPDPRPSRPSPDHPLPGPASAARLPLPTTLFGRPVYYGWYVVAVAFVASMMSAGVQAYTLGVFLKPMTAALGWSRTDISLGQTVSTVATGFLALIVGPIMDRRGGRVLIVVGAVVGGLGFIALGQVHNLWQYYLVRGGLITVGSVGMGTLVVNVAISNWFVRMRGRAIAIGSMGVSASALIMPPLATRLIAAIGWRSAWAVIGVAVWVLVIPPAAYIMRRRPEDHGLVTDGSLAPPGAVLRVRTAGDVRWTRREAARTPALWMLIVAFGCASMGLGAMLLHLYPYLTDRGFSPGIAAAGFSMIGLTGLVGKPLWGLALERFETRLCATVEFLSMAVGILLVLLIRNVATMFGAIFVLGIGIGGVITVQEVVWANYFGRLTLGTVRSIGRPFTIVSSAGGPVLAGAAYDIGHSYDVAFIVFIVTYVIAAGLIFVTPHPVPPAGAVEPASLPAAVEAAS